MEAIVQSRRRREVYTRERTRSRKKSKLALPNMIRFCSFRQLTSCYVHSSVYSATQRRDRATPPCGRSSPSGRSVVDGWRRDERTRDIPQELPRALVSSAKPTTGVQIV